MSMYWVASADHYVHKRSGKFDEAAREKYRIMLLQIPHVSNPRSQLILFKNSLA